MFYTSSSSKANALFLNVHQSPYSTPNLHHLRLHNLKTYSHSLCKLAMHNL